jgi:hypothetical protein
MENRYAVYIYYNGYDNEFDRRIKKAIRKENSGSGYGFGGCRDISWHFTQKPAAERAYKRLKRFKKYNARVELYDTTE